MPVLILWIVLLLTPFSVHASERVETPPLSRGDVALEWRVIPDGTDSLLYGTYSVYEDRAAHSGRMLELGISILPARSETPNQDPLFFVAGGPGQTNAEIAPWYVGWWPQEDRDIVFVDQRGTSEQLRLACELGGSDENLQSYLESMMNPEMFRECLRELETQADLRLYSTSIAADDLDEIRQALGYGRINLLAGSYGTRASLVYMRQYPDQVRSAILNGVAPLSFTNPLFHARSAQEALDRVFSLCAEDSSCATRFPNLKSEFEAVLAILESEPTDATVLHPTTGEAVVVQLTRDGFAEALRVMMYNYDGTRQIPCAIHNAFLGDLDPFAELAIQHSRQLRDNLAFGMLMSVVCAEDVDRIDPERIAAETEGTFLGDGRVRRQIACCDLWPRSELPADYAEPVSVAVPSLIVSGTLDPVTPPRWGADAAKHLPKSRHLIVPGSHFVWNECVGSIVREFLESGAVDSLDTDCVESIALDPFEECG